MVASVTTKICYKTSCAHDCTAADLIQAQIDNTLLPKRYLQSVPTDPRTNARYAYGVTKNGQYYQIAGIIENDDGTYTAKVEGNLHFTYPLKSLIRSFNGPNFVMEGEGFLPYSPDHMSLTASLFDLNGTVEKTIKNFLSNSPSAIIATVNINCKSA